MSNFVGNKTDPSQLRLIEEDWSKTIINSRLIKSTWKIVEVSNFYQTQPT